MTQESMPELLAPGRRRAPAKPYLGVGAVGELLVGHEPDFAEVIDVGAAIEAVVEDVLLLVGGLLVFSPDSTPSAVATVHSAAAATAGADTGRISTTFALQGHDPISKVAYRNIRVKVLPD